MAVPIIVIPIGMVMITVLVILSVVFMASSSWSSTWSSILDMMARGWIGPWHKPFRLLSTSYLPSIFLSSGISDVNRRPPCCRGIA